MSKESKEEDVLLLHGLSKTPKTMNSMADYLSEQGYRVFNIGYPSTQKSISECISIVSKKLSVLRSGQQSRRLHVVGHSTGALIAHALVMLSRPSENWGRVVMLGVPAQGSLLAKKLSRFHLYRTAYGSVGVEISDFGKSMPAITVPCGVIAGSRKHLADLVFIIWLGFKSDGKVKLSETQVLGQTARILVPVAHPDLPNDKRVQEEVGIFLKNAHFSKSDPELEIPAARL